ncbi:MAG: hypothetical protein JW860_01260 [Sedimentisphaerales bacterium]|nr:hypothetical protein [Sedimentisphaerales bacterium]
MTKKITLSLWCLFLLISPCLAYDWGTNPGDGSEANPYQIWTVEQLTSINNSDPCLPLLDKHFILTADIDLDPCLPGGQVFTTAVIAPDTDNSTLATFQGIKFTGTFNGADHVIKNLTISNSNGEDYLGLFGNCDNAIIENLSMKNIIITSTGTYSFCLGGLVGCQNSGIISNCYVSIRATGNRGRIGGLVGTQNSGTIRNCNTCVNLVNLNSYTFTGGLAALSGGIINDCYAIGTISGGGDSALIGGFVGSHSGTINRCFTIVMVFCDSRSEGIGGLAGNSSGWISNCYATATISGGDSYFLGGLVGKSSAIIINCYSTGSLSDARQIGGLVAENGGGVINSFWDIQTSGSSISAGGKGRTTAQMQQLSNYIGWNKPTQTNWVLDEGNDYPRLDWKGTSAIPPLSAEILTDFITNGTGTTEDPYKVTTAEQLNAIGLFPYYWDKVYILDNDIDMFTYLNTDFNRIGVNKYPFTGTFDGNGHVVTNLTYYTAGKEPYIGLFGYADSATIKNLGLENATISSSDKYIGGLLGYLKDSTISNCFACGSLSVTGNRSYHVGGLIGYQDSGTISNCYTCGNVSSTSPLCGGLVGYQDSGTITDCFASTNVSGDFRTGGLVGYQHGTIRNCYATGNVNGIGLWNNEMGGLVGRSESSIINCYATGSITGSNQIGGLVGYQYLGVISNCYATGNVSGSIALGGLVGYQHYYNSVINSYACGTISGSNSKYRGGLVGEAYGGVVNSFWDTQTSGILHSSGGKGRTTTQMQQLSNYIGWNTPTQTIWILDEGNDYPRLTWEGMSGTSLSAEILTDFITNGTGTTGNPYKVTTAEQLNAIGLFPDCWNKSFTLTKDIDLSYYTGTDFNRIGIGPFFTGVFDGNGFIISNFTYETAGSESNIGLFGYTEDAVIKNLGLENAIVSSNGYYLGLLVGGLELSTISNSYANGSLTGDGYLGGLVGYQYLGVISNSYTSGDISGNNNVGGFLGYQYCGMIRNCYTTASVSGNQYIGGLMGYQDGEYCSAEIVNCYAAGAVYGNDYLGGLIGSETVYGLQTDCYFLDPADGGGPDNGIGTPLSDILMKNQSSFTGWDFIQESINGNEDIWHMPYMDTGYPMLWWQRDIPGDVTGKYGVNLLDFAPFSAAWLTTPADPQWNPTCDLAGDPNSIGLDDIIVFIEHWMEGIYIEPAGP